MHSCGRRCGSAWASSPSSCCSHGRFDPDGAAQVDQRLTTGFTGDAAIDPAQKQPSPNPSRLGLAAYRRLIVDLDARLTATEAARYVGISKQLFNYWRTSGKVQPDERGLYRLGDVLDVERRTRRSPCSHRQLCYSGR